MQKNLTRKRSPFIFFGLVYLLSIPFWILGALSSQQLLPNLPIGALMFFIPLLTAAILVYRENGPAGLSRLLKQAFDIRRIGTKRWLLPALLLEPAIKGLSYAYLRLTGIPVPPPQFNLVAALALLPVFFFGALGEELGWSGYAIDPLMTRAAPV